MENGKLPNGVKNGQKNQVKKIAELRVNFNLKNIFLWLFMIFLGVSFFLSFQQETKTFPEKPLSGVMNDVRDNKVQKIEVDGNKLTINYKDGKTFSSYKEAQESLVKLLENAQIDAKQVAISVKNTEMSGVFWNFLSTVLPLVLMVSFFFFIFKQARGAQDSIFSFGQSRAKLFSKDMPKITFANVAGVDEAKQELSEVVDFLRHPQKYQALGARTPRGVLLVGPSGTGKTLLAKAVAGEASVPFFSMAGSEFMEMLVGVGASRVRDLFATAKKSSPSIIFIDEIDAIGRMRSVGVMGGHDEREQTLNQILVEMDGFNPKENVIVVAATNRGDLLDPALMRPGRFDRRVVLDMPDIEGRKAILSIHMKGKPFATAQGEPSSLDVNWDKVAKRTVGFSGADLENMLNEAAILAARGSKTAIDMKDLEEAATKVKLGPERKRLQSDLDKKITAYHEAGHAIVNHELPNMDPVHRISIVSRGLTLGHTLIPPLNDRTHETKSHLLSQIAAMLGGRVAEEIVFKEMTSGASNDISQATQVAREMVIEFGMSSLGPINFGPTTDVTEWGKSWIEQPQVSNQMQDKIDLEVKRIIDEGYQKALAIVKKMRKKLDLVAEELLQKETLEKEEFEQLMST